MKMSFVDKVTLADFRQTGPPRQYRSDRAHVVPKFERTYTDIETPDLSTKNFRGHHESVEPMRPSIKAASGTKNVITPRRSHIKQHQDGYISHHIPAYVNELSVSAFPDSCSSLNLISEDFVLRSNLLFDESVKTTLTLPSHRVIPTMGPLCLSFRFAGELETINPFSNVLRGCVHDVVLSGESLRTKEVFTKFRSRIERRFLRRHIQLPKSAWREIPGCGYTVR
jgi:hypothetical protein